MKLLGSVPSPYTRKVRIVLAEKKIDCDFEAVDVNPPENPVNALNPLGKVPTLVLDEGTVLYDSRVIVEFLDSVSPISRLIPDDNRERVAVRRWEALADGCTDAVVAVTAEKRRPAEKQNPEWLARQQGKIDRALKAMSEELGSRAWCTGDLYNLSDIAAGCALGYLDIRMPDLNWRRLYPNLARLYEKLLQRAPFKDTLPPKA